MIIRGNISSSSLNVEPKPKIGTRFSYAWSANPLNTWTDSTATATVTTDGTKTTVSGGAFNQSNFFSTAHLIGVTNYTISLTAVVNDKSATSFGLGIGIRSLTTGVPTVFGHFRLADTEGYISFTNGTGLPDGNSVNNDGVLNFIWSAGDTLRFVLERRGRDINIKMINVTNSSVSELTYNFVSGGVGNPYIYFYGGNYDLTGNFVITYEDPEEPEFAVIGDSITFGSGAESVATSWVSVASQRLNGGIVRMAAPVEQSIDGTRRLDDITTWVKPKNLLIAYGVNDFLQSVSTANFDTRVRQIVTDCQAAGINPILLTLVPQSTDVAAFNAVLADIASDESCVIFDIYTLLKANVGTGIATEYAGDGVHPGHGGHIFMGNTIGQYISPLVTDRAPIVFGTLPNCYNSVHRYLALSKDSELVSVYGGSDTGYIFNRQAVNIIGDAQDASIFINGRATFSGLGVAGTSDFMIVGNSGSMANPNFRVQAGTTNATTLTAGTFSCGNFSISTTPIFTGGNVIWQSNPVNMTSSPFVIMVSNPAGNGITAGLTVDNNTTNYTNATDAIQRWRKSGVTVATIFRDGNCSFTGSITSGVAGSSLGSLLLSGDTSGTVTIRPASAAGTYTLTLPDNDGTTADQPLITNGSGTTSWGPVLASGTYTSTLTNVTNVSSSSQVAYTYQRIGSIVQFAIRVSVTATGAGATELGLSIPVSSNFSSADNAIGTVTSSLEIGTLDSDSTNDRLRLTYSAQGAGTEVFSITGQYQII